MDKIDVKSLEIRDYAISGGWKLVKEAIKDGLFVLNSPHDDTQLIFPKDEASSDFQELSNITIKRLSEVYKTSFHKIIDEIREVNDDVISLRYYSENKIVNSISFEEAFDAIEATRQLLLSAASSVVNPARFHPKLNRTEPQELIKKARFRHTQEGSFIIKVSCPFELVTVNQGMIFPDQIEKPLSRKALELLNSSSVDLLEAIESDTIKELYESQEISETPIISYNFCDALVNLYDDERELPFELIFNWSKASMQKIPLPSLINRISFSYSQKTKIQEAKEYFAPKRKDISGTFYGTVETLDGTVGEDDKRSGPVVLSILYENEILKTKVNLPSNFYEIAVDAHKKGGAYVQIKGDLKRNKRSNTFETITEFNLSV